MLERTTLIDLHTNRPIRSFVERRGRISPIHQQLIPQLWPRYGLPLTNDKLDMKQIFGREAPTILEVGFGNGRTLLKTAQQNPQQDFIGIEVYRAGIVKLLVGIRELGVNNIRIFYADAVEVLENCIADDTLQRVQLFFPDPWPKSRHNKRRIVQPAFTKLVASKITKHGTLHLATDWQDYAQQMLTVLEAQDFWLNTAGKNQFVERPSTRPLTKFEQRGLRLGYDTWDLVFRKL